MNRAQKILIFFLSVSSYSMIWTIRMHFIHVAHGIFDDAGQAADHLDLSPQRIIADQHQRENDAQFFVRNRRSLHDMKAWNTTGEAENSLHVRSFDETKSEASTRRFNGNVSNMTSRCALCFFGLPRSYKDMVLPSIQKNIILPNAKHGCDVFVHYYYKFEEDPGRFNRGGKMDPDEILLLQDAVSRSVAIRNVSVAVKFINDTDDQFEEKQDENLSRYYGTVDDLGHPAYFPWKERDWKPDNLVNVVRQWHSIESVFYSMEEYAEQHGINYTRVGMFRNDAMYLTPIDIMNGDENHVVLPSFASYPVNDRMIYGPYSAVKIWATKRFELIEERLKVPSARGYVMHSERFMVHSIFPSIKTETGISRHIDTDICFLRTRVNSIAVLNDCSRHCMVMKDNETLVKVKDCVEQKVVRSIPHDEEGMKRLVETTAGLECQEPQFFDSIGWPRYIQCGSNETGMAENG